MVFVWRWILVCSLLFAGVPRLWGAPSADTRAFTSACESFRAAFYGRAEAEFAEFAQKFPTSPHLPEAHLFQARSRIELTNFAGALELLSAHQATAGPLIDQYLLWTGEALLRQGDARGAAEIFGRVSKEFPASPCCLDAAIGRAVAWMSLSEWTNVISLLQDTNGCFQAAARTNAAAESVVRGFLLLGEAQLAQQDYPAAEATLQSLTQPSVSPRLAWQRQLLLCRVLLASGRVEAALQSSTNLLTLAAATGRRSLQADSAAFRASILEQLGRADEAIAAYQLNLAEGFPPDRQSQAFLKIAGLHLGQGRLLEAALALDQYLARYPAGTASDLALLTLGELRLRQHLVGLSTNQIVIPTNAPAGTNLLEQAMTALNGFVTRFPESQLIGKAQLNLGWCYELAGRLAESQGAFQAAAQRLPLSADQAIAYFKLADVQFRQTNYAGALTNYSVLLERFASLPDAPTNLFEPALYQKVRSGVAAGDLSAATNALGQLLARYPAGYHTERAGLLTGQEFGRQNPAAARQIFQEVVSRVPQAALMPELQLAVARTYEQEGKWEEVVQEYDRWLTAHRDHPAAARAEYARAWAHFEVRRDTNALTCFTNFIARFPTHDLVPFAQWWVADYSFRSGKHQEAEQQYQAIYQNTNLPPCRLTYEAVMMAGRCAVARQGWENAADYFRRLANDTNCPPELRAKAFYALGDYWVSRGSTNKLEDYRQALAAYERSVQTFPSTQQAALAWGGKANCWLQSAPAAEQYESLTNALEAFQQVLAATNVGVTARSIAKVGLGVTLEKMAEQKKAEEQAALRQQALDHYLDVFTGKILRDGEERNLFWTQEAGLKAARVAETFQQWESASRVYRSLQELLPSQHSRLQKSIDKCREQLERARN